VGAATDASLPPLRESWQPVSLTAPAAPSRSNAIGAIALAVVVAFVVGVGVMHFRSSDSLPAGTSAFAAGKGVVFTSPDGVYQAQFPQAVTTELAPSAGNGLILRRAYAKSDSYEIVAASSVAPAPVPAASVNILLEAGLSAEIANLNGKLQNKKETTFAGMPAIEASFKGSDGYPARILVVASGADIFEVVVHAKTGADKLFYAFESSLIIY